MTLRQKRMIRGFIKSWTANTGVILASLGYLQTQNQMIDKYLGPDTTGLVMMGFGLLIVMLRAKTTESLESKGK